MLWRALSPYLPRHRRPGLSDQEAQVGVHLLQPHHADIPSIAVRIPSYHLALLHPRDVLGLTQVHLIPLTSRTSSRHHLRPLVHHGLT